VESLYLVLDWCPNGVLEEKMDQTIHRHMTIENILMDFPTKAMALSEAMANAGLHCVGCGAATFETLEQGVFGHGFTEEELQSLLAELNSIVGDLPEANVEEGAAAGIQLTSRAISKVKTLMQNDENAIGLRISVLAGGCAGHSYNMTFTKTQEKGDWVGEQDGLKIYIDPESLQFLSGMEVDFVDTLNDTGFKFNNPNARSACSCGTSFR
jgi:iron-sulfur cluster assembly accessory protein